MLLKSIEFDNFRCFRDKVTIDLTSDEHKNIVVILGDNTNGKSTIVQAFVWCFYGIANFDNPEIYNRAVANNLPLQGKTTSSVKVVFEHENVIYTAHRTQEFFKTVDGKMICPNHDSRFVLNYVDGKTGQTLPCGKISSEMAKAINAIMPKDLAPYFFFAGEKNNELTTKSLSSAVKNLLGIEALSKMREHLHGNSAKVANNSVMGYYLEKQVDSSNLQAQQEWQKKTRAEEDLNKVEERLEEITSEIDEYEKKIEDINQILRDAAPTKHLQTRRDQLKQDIDRENKQLQINMGRFISDFNDNAVNLFTLPLLKKARENLDKMDLSDKGIVGLEVSAIKELLNRHVCLCGTQLNEGSLAYQNVEKYIDILPPKSVGVLVRQLQDSMSQSELSANDYVKKVSTGYQLIQFSLDKIHDYEREEDEVLSQLKDIGDVNTSQYETDLRTYKARIQGLRDEERIAIACKTNLSSNIETATKNYNMYIAKSEKNKEYELYYAYSERVYQWLSETYDVKEKEIREKLQNNVTELFNNIYNGNRKVEIDSTYNIVITPPADTGGIKAIQYFSYVGGLVKVAKQVMAERKKDESFGEEYPLVLDAAFSHTDTKHTKAIATELSNVTNQLVFAIMDKDWEHVANQIQDRIAKTYKLIKISEDEVNIE